MVCVHCRIRWCTLWLKGLASSGFLGSIMKLASQVDYSAEACPCMLLLSLLCHSLMCSTWSPSLSDSSNRPRPTIIRIHCVQWLHGSITYNVMLLSKLVFTWISVLKKTLAIIRATSCMEDKTFRDIDWLIDQCTWPLEQTLSIILE